MKNLKVTDTYTTKQGESAGAITITCTTEDGKEITVAEWAGMTPEEVQDNLPTLQTLFEINDFNDLEVFGFYLHTVDVIE